MKNQTALLMAIISLLVGCSRQAASRDTNVVPERELSAYLEQTNTGDYHDLARAGRALLKPGLVIPDHKTRLKAVPSGTPEAGMIRYELMSFKGDSSAGGITLFLKADTGEIIELRTIEATL